MKCNFGRRTAYSQKKLDMKKDLINNSHGTIEGLEWQKEALENILKESKAEIEILKRQKSNEDVLSTAKNRKYILE